MQQWQTEKAVVTRGPDVTETYLGHPKKLMYKSNIKINILTDEEMEVK